MTYLAGQLFWILCAAFLVVFDATKTGRAVLPAERSTRNFRGIPVFTEVVPIAFPAPSVTK